jgi:hypothetical protein
MVFQWPLTANGVSIVDKSTKKKPWRLSTTLSAGHLLANTHSVYVVTVAHGFFFVALWLY